MANYLPVLLVSLTNAAPDDSALKTAPRAQVDYLSHDWQEEDVWRSWRNMTRQKNAIANGARLENASWRTWWKQRNKLGTVSPETLNWLKDSDVTWLYGPLHTATDWKPPPRQPSLLTNPATAAPARPNSPSSNRPHHSSAVALYKPILKHRSISELLTSDIPVTSPIFSPIDSGEESEITDINSGDGSFPPTSSPKRPALLHTKSDTLITRWGSDRTFRKGSPSRLDSPEDMNGTQRRSAFSPHILSTGGAVRASHSQDSNSSEKSAATGSDHSQTRHKKKHISFNTFVEQCIAIDKPKKNASGTFSPVAEASWMGGRPPWEDETGYEEDKEDSEEEKVYFHRSHWTPDGLESAGTLAIREDSDSPGEDDDDDDPIEIRSSSSSRSTLRAHKKPFLRSHSKVSTTSSSSSASTSTTSSSRSDVGTLSTDNTSSPSGSLSPTRRISSSSCLPRKNSASLLGGSRPVYRRSSTTTLMSTYRPSVNRTPRAPLSRSPLESNRPQHVTIAPIAPTLLKTTPTSWTENLGDDGAASSDDIFAGWVWGVGGKVAVGDYARNRREDRDQDGGLQRRRSWTSGYRADSYPGAFETGRGLGFGVPHNVADKDEHSSDGTPVELVYVPPFEYDYQDEPGDDETGSHQEGERPHTRENAEIEEVEDIEMPGGVYHQIPGIILPSSTSTPMNLHGSSNVPTVVVDEGPSSSSFSVRDKQRFQLPTVEESAQDPYDYFGGPDMGDDYFYYSRGSGRGYEHSTTGAVTSRGRTSNPKSSPRTSHVADQRQITREQERNSRGNGEERQSRSRSRSQSRTPSPALLSSHSNSAATMGELGADGKNKSASSSVSNGLLAPSSPRTFSQSDLLLLPARGRQPDAPSRSLNGISPQQDERRGRSTTRTSSSSSSWDRERGSSGSLSSTSPIGSLSPDGSDVSRRCSGPGVVSVLGTVLGSGRGEDREIETGRERRGRERTSSRVLSGVTPAADQSVGMKNMDASFASATSSSSSSNASTIVPKQVPLSNEEDPELVYMRLAEETLSKNATPTPTNSPVLTSWAPKPQPSSLVSHYRAHTTPIILSGDARTDVARMPTSTSHGPILPTSPSSNPSPIRSPSKFRPPLTLKPTSPSPAKPRTSFTAAVSPTVSPSATMPVPSAGVSHAESTIVGKAVDIVSSAGLYFGLWGRERSASAPSSPL